MKISVRVRVICGSALMIAGYFPVLSDFLSSLSVADMHSNEVRDFAFFEQQKESCLFLDCSSKNTSLVGGLLQNQLYKCVDFVSVLTNTTSSRESAPVKLNTINSIKVVSGGSFHGSKFVKGCISSNFYVDARRLGVPAAVVDGVINKLSCRIDFKHSLKRGDKFEIIYNQKNIMLYSKIVTKHRQAAVYKFPRGNDSNYYFENGAKVVYSKSGSFFGRPLKGKLCVSSPFGLRIHPLTKVLGRHNGVDLNTPHGSPVYSISDGVVSRASRYYGYGNCVDVNHHYGYSSRYAHLSKYVVKCGMRVRKGQLIAYSGNSGSTNGAHLHLELAKNNRPMNPLSIKMIEESRSSYPNGFQNLKKEVCRIMAR